MAPANKLLAVQYKITGSGVVPTDNVDATAKLETFVSQIFGVLTVIGVLYFIFQIIIAGYSFMTSKGDEKAMESSRKRLTDGVMGILIIAIAVGIGSLLSSLLGLNNPLDIQSMFTNFGL